MSYMYSVCFGHIRPLFPPLHFPQGTTPAGLPTLLSTMYFETGSLSDL